RRGGRAARSSFARERRHLHDRGDGRQEDRFCRRTTRDRDARLRPHERAGPAHRGGHRSGDRRGRHAGRQHQRDRTPEDPDQGRGLDLPVRADQATPARVPRRGRGLSVAKARRPSSRSGSRAPRGRSTTARFQRDLARIFTPEVVRSIVGTAMMALGAITLIALILPGQGALTDWWRDSIAPWFETGRWLLPFLLVGGGWSVAGGPGRAPGSGWGMTIAGLGIAYIAALGAFEVLKVELFDTERGGGRIGRFLAGTLQPLLTGPGTFVLLAAIAGLGLMLAFNLQLRDLIAPFTGAARWVGSTTAASMGRATHARPQKPAPPPASRAAKAAAAAAAKPPVAVPMAPADELAGGRSLLHEHATRHKHA